MAAGQGFGTPSDSGSVTTASVDDLLVGANYVVGYTPGPGSGYTSRVITGDGSILEDSIVKAIGTYSATAPVDCCGWIMQMVAFRVGQAAVITSANAVTFDIGALDSFTVTATGAPAPTLSEIGHSARWRYIQHFHRHTERDTCGWYRGQLLITFTAHNGIGTDATQSFTLTVGQGSSAPLINSPNSASFVVGTAGSFMVTATGSPTPTLSETGTLPTGVTFDTSSGLLSGTPAAGTLGSYPITFTADNGVGTDATQNFTLTVNSAPVITTEPQNQTVNGGQTATFMVAVTGSSSADLSMAEQRCEHWWRELFHLYNAGDDG